MKPSEVLKLRRLANVKSEAGKARFGAINAAQAALRFAAADHAAKAARPYTSESDEVTGGDLFVYGHYLRHHDRAAKERRRAAEALEDEKRVQRAALARSLGEEAALSALHNSSAADRRRKANDAEEAGRSDLAAGAASAGRRRG